MNEIALHPIIVIYHRKKGCICQDGQMAAFLMYLYFLTTFKVKNIEDFVEFFPMEYNDTPPDVTDKAVFIVDFSFPPAVFKEMVAKANSIICLDHHDSAMEAYADMLSPPDADGTSYVVFEPQDSNKHNSLLFLNKNKSGALMTYEFIEGHLMGGEPGGTCFSRIGYPRLYKAVQCVSDRDLWNFTLEDTKAVYEVLNSIPEDFASWKKVLINEKHETYNQRLSEAKAYLAKLDTVYQTLSQKFHRIDFMGYHDIPVLNCPNLFASYVGELLNKQLEVPFTLSYDIHGTTVHWSVRCRKGTKKAKPIAAKMGGGGHDDAGGFQTSLSILETILSGKY